MENWNFDLLYDRFRSQNCFEKIHRWSQIEYENVQMTSVYDCSLILSKRNSFWMIDGDSVFLVKTEYYEPENWARSVFLKINVFSTRNVEFYAIRNIISTLQNFRAKSLLFEFWVMRYWERLVLYQQQNFDMSFIF